MSWTKSARTVASFPGSCAWATDVTFQVLSNYPAVLKLIHSGVKLDKFSLH